MEKKIENESSLVWDEAPRVSAFACIGTRARKLNESYKEK